MKLYTIYLNFVDTISGTFSAKHCICLSTDKKLMEYLARKYNKRTNADCFPQQIYTFETLDWGDLQDKFDLTPQQVQYFLNRMEDKMVVTEFEMNNYEFNLAKFIDHYMD